MALNNLVNGTFNESVNMIVNEVLTKVPTSEFLIASSLLGLGLLIAIYTLVSPEFDKIFDKKARDLKRKIEEEGKIYERLGRNIDNMELTANLLQIQQEIKDLKKIPFYHNWGFFISSIFFTISLLISIYNISNLPFLGNSPAVEIIVFNSHLFFIGGAIVFLYVWFAIIIELRTLMREKFDKAIVIEKEISEDFSDIIESMRKKGKSKYVTLLKKRY